MRCEREQVAAPDFRIPICLELLRVVPADPVLAGLAQYALDSAQDTVQALFALRIAYGARRGQLTAQPRDSPRPCPG